MASLNSSHTRAFASITKEAAVHLTTCLLLQESLEPTSLRGLLPQLDSLLYSWFLVAAMTGTSDLLTTTLSSRHCNGSYEHGPLRLNVPCLPQFSPNIFVAQVSSNVAQQNYEVSRQHPLQDHTVGDKWFGEYQNRYGL